MRVDVVRNGMVLILMLILRGQVAASVDNNIAGEEVVRSPDGRLVCIVGTGGGLHYRVMMDSAPVLVDSRLGLEIEGGLSLGPAAVITGAARDHRDATWNNPFGSRRVVSDRYDEMRVELEEHGKRLLRFAVIVRAYNNGVAFRYELPKQPGLNEFVITDEKSEFAFAADHRCWVGNYSKCAECDYPERRLSRLGTDTAKPHVLPLLVELGTGLVAIAESDLIDWAGMFISASGPGADGTRCLAAKVTLAPRTDKHGAVVVTERRLSPWRVLMLGRTAAELINGDLIATLATPSRIEDTSWIKPGVAAWDPWWCGVNAFLPNCRGMGAYGDTRSHKAYIDFAAEMGWTYQLMDWRWYGHVGTPQADITKPLPHVDIPGLVRYAKDRNVKLLLWVHSNDITRLGVEKTLGMIAAWGLAGVKIDFMDSDSQETVCWYAEVLAAAARHRLVVDFHGAYKPTGLARTWPNFITQEGVMGNEYNKMGASVTPRYTVTLPFARGLLGPMDFTPGGFRNRTVSEFNSKAIPAEVMGTRARQLAMTVIYPSPLLCLCDSPEAYRGQPGVEFLRGLPTVWDDTAVLSAKIADHVVLARR